MSARLDGDLELGPDAVGRSDQDRIFEPGALEIEKPAEAANLVPVLAEGDDDLEALIASRKAGRKEKSGGFCPKCGKPILRSDRFCPHCGKSIK